VASQRHKAWDVAVSSAEQAYVLSKQDRVERYVHSLDQMVGGPNGSNLVGGSSAAVSVSSHSKQLSSVAQGKDKQGYNYLDAHTSSILSRFSSLFLISSLKALYWLPNRRYYKFVILSY